ncbi:hypothetical protein ACNOYE_17055 [Nannocystaceae bacterium ST9]
MLRTFCTTITLGFGLLVSLAGCDPTTDELELAQLELEALELEALELEALEHESPELESPEQFADEQPIVSAYACESTELELPGDLAAPTGPFEGSVPGGGGGCGSSYIVYGNWVTTTTCGGCYVGGMPGKKQVKVDTWMNQCGITGNIVHEQCTTC